MDWWPNKTKEDIARSSCYILLVDQQWGNRPHRDNVNCDLLAKEKVTFDVGGKVNQRTNKDQQWETDHI